MQRYEAHVTDEWQRDTMVIQTRRLASNGNTQAIAYFAEDADGMATLSWHRIDPAKGGQEHLVPTPGVRIPHDVAVAMARAILTDAGKDADEVERLKDLVDNLQGRITALGVTVEEVRAARDLYKREVEMLELLVEAKDAHLEREARTATVFVRGLEMTQGTAEVEAERANHPAYSATLEVTESEAQAITHWATEVASSTGRDLSEVLDAYERLNARG
jgi:hypothetical protein